MGLSGAGGSSSLGHPIPEQTEKTGVAGSQSQTGSERAKEKEGGGKERRKSRLRHGDGKGGRRVARGSRAQSGRREEVGRRGGSTE